MPDCPRCHAGLDDVTLCERCGWTPPLVPVQLVTVRRRCPADGAELDGDGFCPRGNGYPLGKLCPFVCPLCRGELDWSGGCERCHGCTTGERLDWTFPGDRYDCYDDKGQPIGDGRHWVRTDGPRKACTPAQNADGIRAIQRILAKSTIASKGDRGRRGGAA